MAEKIVVDSLMRVNKNDFKSVEQLKAMLYAPNPEYLEAVKMGKNVNGIPRMYPLWKEVGNEVQFPRAIANRYLNSSNYEIVDNTVLGHEVDFKSKIKLRTEPENQVAFVEPFYKAVKDTYGATGQASAGTGKGHTLDTKIYTPDGTVYLEDIEVGDKVIGSDGKPITVTGVFDRGEIDTYRVIFTDNTSIKCDKDHLFEVIDKYGNRYVKTVAELKDNLVDNDGLKWSIPIVEPIQFNEKDVPIEPYVLGTTLEVNSDFSGIPKMYKYNSKAVRLRVLRGILDKAGVVDNGVNNVLEYETSSKALAFDVQEVVQTLGGICTVDEGNVSGKRNYRCIIEINEVLFTTQHKEIKRKIKAIEPIGKEPIICISVDAEDKLYCAENCIVTHNTVMSLDMVSRLQRTTLVIVHKTFLVNQWIDRIMEFYDIKRSEIGIVRQDRCEYIGKKIVVALVQSLLSRDYPEEFYNYFGTVVIDECYSDDTDILTERGWVRFKDLKEDDKVAQYSLDGVEFVKPIRHIKRHYKGKMVRIHGRQVDILVTPNHDITYSMEVDGKRVLKKRKAKDMKLYPGIDIPMAGVKKTGRDSLTPVERLQIVIQADGYIVPETHSNGRYSGCRSVQFSFKKERKIKRFEKILSEVGFEYSKNPVSRDRFRYIVKIPKKYVVSDMFRDWVDLSKVSGKWGKEFLQELVHWDGYYDDNYPERIYYSTRHSDNLDIVQEIAAISGYTGTRMLQVDNRSENYSDIHRIYLWEREFKTTQSITKDYIDYDGNVYCVEVPTGNIIVRRNGCVSVSGNCHRFGADTFRESIPMFPARYRIGLTATPYRNDTQEIVVFSHVGEIVSVLQARSNKPEIYFVKTPVIFDRIATKQVSLYGKVHLAKLTTYLAEHEGRNRQIAKLVVNACEAGRKIIVLSGRRKQLEILRTMIKAEGKKQDMNISVAYYVGGMSEEALKIAENHQVLLGTMQMAREGLDVPDLDTLFLATPISDIEQAVGRILRLHEDKKKPMVVDFVDNIGICYGMMKKRTKEYERLEYEIK